MAKKTYTAQRDGTKLKDGRTLNQGQEAELEEADARELVTQGALAEKAGGEAA